MDAKTALLASSPVATVHASHARLEPLLPRLVPMSVTHALAVSSLTPLTTNALLAPVAPSPLMRVAARLALETLCPSRAHVRAHLVAPVTSRIPPRQFASSVQKDSFLTTTVPVSLALLALEPTAAPEPLLARDAHVDTRPTVSLHLDASYASLESSPLEILLASAALATL